MNISIGFTKQDLQDNLNMLSDNVGNWGDVQETLDIGFSNSADSIPEYRLRKINTPAGVQYCLKQCGFRGEGSGFYTPDLNEITDMTFNMLNDLCRTTENRRERMIEAGGLLRETAERLQKESNVLQITPRMVTPLRAPFAQSTNEWFDKLVDKTVTL